MNGAGWTPEEIETVRAMKGAGKTNAEIATALGRSLQAVKSKAVRMDDQAGTIPPTNARSRVPARPWPIKRPPGNSATVTLSGVEVTILCDDTDVLARAVTAVIRS